MFKSTPSGGPANSNTRSLRLQTNAPSTDLGLAAIRAAGGPRRALAQLAERLEQRALSFERTRDPRCVFALAYARLTLRLSDTLLNAGFSDPDWVVLLSLRFADHYFCALHERATGTLGYGAWATVFEASEQRRTSVLEELVLGMTAHVVNDLPLALCEVGMTTESGSSHVHDYHAMNEVLGQAIEDVQRELTRRYDPWLGALDKVFENYDAVLKNHGLRLTRAAAWYNALRLLDPDSQAAARAAIARGPEITLHELMHPPIWSLRFALRGARLLSRLTRRWPEPERAAGR
jgi:hypothetical protein